MPPILFSFFVKRRFSFAPLALADQIIPQVLPAVVGYILYRFDVSIRHGARIGWGRGLGFSLITTMKMFNYHETAACILVIIVLVSAADWISARLQKMIL